MNSKNVIWFKAVNLEGLTLDERELIILFCGWMNLLHKRDGRFDYRFVLDGLAEAHGLLSADNTFYVVGAGETFDPESVGCSLNNVGSYLILDPHGKIPSSHVFPEVSAVVLALRTFAVADEFVNQTIGLEVACLEP